MLFEWWNAREVVEIGKTLADCFRPQGGRELPGREQARPFGIHQHELDSFLRRVTREVGPRKLGLLSRAKLLNSFKWRLREHGFDAGQADELTQMVLFQLYGNHSNLSTLTPGGAPEPIGRKRIADLLTEADAHFAAGKLAETAGCLRRVLRTDPHHALAHAKLGATLSHLGEYEEAERMLRRAVELDARSAAAHFNLGALLYYRGEFAAAETFLRRAAKLNPRDPETLVCLGLTLGARSRLDNAKDCFAKALVLKPRNASALCGLGWLAGIEGRFEDSEKLYRDALAADPRRPNAWASLAEIRRMTTADGDWLENVRRLVTADMAPLDEAALRFAMGKYFDDLGNFAEAFSQYKRGNELYKKVARPYDRKARSAAVEETVGLYSAERMRPGIEGASQSTKPVFVVGMMRSGTTLVEQIIASHPRAAGAGELDFWTEAVRKHRDILDNGLPDPALAAKLGNSYLAILSRQCRDALRVVDKSTFNSDHLGLIHSIFPKSRIIYVQRDPVDTCLSCYFQHFANAAGFTFDLMELAHYYREHHRLMQHWRSVLPHTVFLEIPYAELVSDQEAWSRRLMEFIGLEWDPRCLEYYKTKRSVLTASTWQVRQQIYSSSVGRWQNYRKFIRPLLKLKELNAT